MAQAVDSAVPKGGPAWDASDKKWKASRIIEPMLEALSIKKGAGEAGGSGLLVDWANEEELLDLQTSLAEGLPGANQYVKCPPPLTFLSGEIWQRCGITNETYLYPSRPQALASLTAKKSSTEPHNNIATYGFNPGKNQLLYFVYTDGDKNKSTLAFVPTNRIIGNRVLRPPAQAKTGAKHLLHALRTIQLDEKEDDDFDGGESDDDGIPTLSEATETLKGVLEALENAQTRLPTGLSGGPKDQHAGQKARHEQAATLVHNEKKERDKKKENNRARQNESISTISKLADAMVGGATVLLKDLCSNVVETGKRTFDRAMNALVDDDDLALNPAQKRRIKSLGGNTQYYRDSVATTFAMTCDHAHMFAVNTRGAAERVREQAKAAAESAAHPRGDGGSSSSR